MKPCNPVTRKTEKTIPPRQSSTVTNTSAPVCLDPKSLLAHLSRVTRVTRVTADRECSSDGPSRPVEAVTHPTFGEGYTGYKTTQSEGSCNPCNPPKNPEGYKVDAPPARTTAAFLPPCNPVTLVTLEKQGGATFRSAHTRFSPTVTAVDLIARYGEWLIVDIDGHRHEIRTRDVIGHVDIDDYPELMQAHVMRSAARSLATEGKVAAHRLHAAGSGSVRCIDCRHFRRSDEHPHLGACAAGVPPTAAAGFWDTARRFCDAFTPRTEP